MTKHIIPRYKLMLFYDIAHQDSSAYYDFVMNDMIPAAQEMGLYFFRVFHTLWGEYPIRQAEFVAEDLDTIREVLRSEAWQQIEIQFREYVTNYDRKIVRFRPGFQF